MTNPTPPPNAQEVGNGLGRVNRLGNATERLFSRLYRGIGRKSRLQAEMQRAQQLAEQNRQLHGLLQKRDIEVERLNSILGSIDEGVIMQDNEGRIVVVNAAARNLIGSQKNFWDSDLGTLFNNYANITQIDSELAPLGEPVRLDINNRVIGAQLAAVADSQGNRLGTMIVLRDVTRETLADRLKDQFITAISHELRTPMTVIKGMSEVMMAAPPDAKPNRKLLETLSRNIDILDRMVVELLDISELSSGEFNIRKDPIDLETIIWNTVNGMRPEIKRAQLDVAVMVRDENALSVLGDDQRLRWALGHLLQNSIHYTEAGGHVVITLRRADENNVAVQVVDTGVGISEEDLPHVFEQFYRGKPRTRGGKLIDPRGLGQGLFIAHKVTQAHNGVLTVHSAPGEGSLFTMVLPAAS